MAVGTRGFGRVRQFTTGGAHMTENNTRRPGVTIPTPILIAVIALLIGGLVGFFIGEGTAPNASPALVAPGTAVQPTEPAPESPALAPSGTPSPTVEPEPELLPLDATLRALLGDSVQTLRDDGTVVDAPEATLVYAPFTPAYTPRDCLSVDSADGFWGLLIVENEQGVGLVAELHPDECPRF